jgi:hypothetical protein
MLLQDLGVFPLTMLFRTWKSSEHSFYQAKRCYIDKWHMDGDCKPGFQSLQIAKLRDDLLYIQKFKMPLSPVHELNNTEYLLQKLEDETNNFREMLPRLDTRRAVLSAVGSMLKWFFGTATLLDVEDLQHKTVDTMQ